MRRQWTVVVAGVAVLGIGALVLIRTAPPRIEVGVRAPNFTAVDLANGQTVSLDADYRGQVTLVNVWETTCIPCREEIPAIDSLYRALHPSGLRIAAVSVDPLPGSIVRHFADSFHVAFDVLHDPAGAIESRYQTTGVPESFLVDKSGHIVRIAQRAAPWNSPENRRIISELLAEPAG